MPKKKTLAEEPILLGRDLSLDEWLSLLGTDKWAQVYPNNCFPSDKHREEYLSRIREQDEREFRKLARSFINKTGYYGTDKGQFEAVLEKYGTRKVLEEAFDSEWDRRAIPKNGPQWEGITWMLDLLPGKPLDAIAAIRAYVRAHMLYFTDQMIYGHNDVVDMIQARYQVVAKDSCFISYGGPDEKFARMLYESLTTAGVQAFFFPSHAVPGKRLHKVMREGVNQYDRIILVCSKASLDRPGVRNELTETLQREAREGGKDYLIPIRLDDYVFTDWAPDERQLAQAVRDRVVADFTGTMRNKGKYKKALAKLVSALEQPPTGK